MKLFTFSQSSQFELLFWIHGCVNTLCKITHYHVLSNGQVYGNCSYVCFFVSPFPSQTIDIFMPNIMGT